MIFHPRQKKISVNVPLTLENTVIKQVTQTKFLVFSLISIQTLYLVLLLCMSFVLFQTKLYLPFAKAYSAAHN